MDTAHPDIEGLEDDTAPLSRTPEDLFPEPAGEPTTVTSVAFSMDADTVTRQAELERLRGHYRDAVELGELGFVTILGTAGMGKSYLVGKLIDEIQRRKPSPRVLVGQADRRETPFSAFIQVLYQRFSISASDNEETVQRKIEAGVSESMPTTQARETSHLLAHICGAPFPDSSVLLPLIENPQQLLSRIFIAVRRLLAADAARRPLVLCLEHVDEADTESIKLLHYLAAGLANAPVLLVCTADETLFSTYPGFGEGDIPLSKIDLGPLPPDRCVDLFSSFGHLLERIPTVLEDHVRRLSGSPRAVRELMHLLVESGVICRGEAMTWRIDENTLSTLNLPDSHEDLIAERVRVMPGARADVLVKAATIGEVFWLDAIVALSRAETHGSHDPDGPTLTAIVAAGDHSRLTVIDILGELIRGEWIEAVPDPSLRGEMEYRFTYPHLWSCIAEGVNAKQLRSRQPLVAQWLELRPTSSSPENQQKIAEHLEIAGDYHSAARCYRRAAEAAKQSYANASAIRLYRRALDCLGDVNISTRVQLWHDLGTVYELQGDLNSALGAYERMLRLSWMASARSKAAAAFNKMGRIWRKKGDLQVALDYLERGHDLFRRARDEAGVAGSLDDIGQVLHLLGRYDDAFKKITQALTRRGRRGDPRSIAHSLSNLGNIQKDRGHFGESETCHREALELRRQIADRPGIVTSLNNLACLAYEHGNYDVAREGWSEALDEAEDMGSLPLQALALGNLGELARVQEHFDEGRRRLSECLDLAAELQDPIAAAECARNLALIEHAQGDGARARTLAHRARETADRAGLRDHLGRCLLTLGEVYADTIFDADHASESEDGSAEAPAQRYFIEGIAMLREIGNESELARGLESFGRYRLELGDRRTGLELLQESLTLFERLGMARQTERVTRLLDDL